MGRDEKYLRFASWNSHLLDVWSADKPILDMRTVNSRERRRLGWLQTRHRAVNQEGNCYYYYKNYSMMQIYRVCFFRQLENGSIEIHSPDLNEALSLSTADLRFADYLINHVKEYVEKGEQEAGKLQQTCRCLILFISLYFLFLGHRQLLSKMYFLYITLG